jgi:hypothetical protein
MFTFHILNSLPYSFDPQQPTFFTISKILCFPVIYISLGSPTKKRKTGAVLFEVLIYTYPKLSLMTMTLSKENSIWISQFSQPFCKPWIRSTY